MTYTPTTQDVREAYPHSKCLPAFYDPSHAQAVEDAQSEFDRWLREERNKARLEILEDMRDTLWAYGPKGAMQYLNRMIELYR